jgi:hypothetical protein
MEENHERLARPWVRRHVQLTAPGERIAAAIGMRRTGKLGLDGRILTMAAYLEEQARIVPGHATFL